MKIAAFKTRHRITGTWTTRTSLHIGDGEVADLENRGAPPGAATTTKPSTVCVDHTGKACIPGSSLKGPLRSLAKKILAPNMVNALFGHENADDTDARAGAVIYSTAFHESGHNAEKFTPASDSDRARPYWDPTRHTAVDIHVSINRQTRTADDQKLFATEYVPAGETFRWEIVTEGLNDFALAALLFLLDQSSLARFGAGTSRDWGQLSWKREKIEVFGLSERDEWLKNSTVPLPWSDYKLADHFSDSVENHHLVIDLTIKMESPWLVRDPRQRQRMEATADREARQTMPHARPLVNHAGTAYLPASSLKGVLRSHAERILRTVGLPCPDQPENEDAHDPSLAAILFGHSGARATLNITDFDASTDVTEHRQEHVAIDRFTGGAADGAKFTETSATSAALTGTLTLDLKRIKDRASLGLLAHLLRDLSEGEITLGSGSAKGRGFCTAKITIDGHEPWHTHPDIQIGLNAFHQSLPKKNNEPVS